jgi:hypothetical protein
MWLRPNRSGGASLDALLKHLSSPTIPFVLIVPAF